MRRLWRAPDHCFAKGPVRWLDAMLSRPVLRTGMLKATKIVTFTGGGYLHPYPLQPHKGCRHSETGIEPFEKGGMAIRKGGYRHSKTGIPLREKEDISIRKRVYLHAKRMVSLFENGDIPARKGERLHSKTGIGLFGNGYRSIRKGVSIYSKRGIKLFENKPVRHRFLHPRRKIFYKIFGYGDFGWVSPEKSGFLP